LSESTAFWEAEKNTKKMVGEKPGQGRKKAAINRSSV